MMWGVEYLDGDTWVRDIKRWEFRADAERYIDSCIELVAAHCEYGVSLHLLGFRKVRLIENPPPSFFAPTIEAWEDSQRFTRIVSLE